MEWAYKAKAQEPDKQKLEFLGVLGTEVAALAVGVRSARRVFNFHLFSSRRTASGIPLPSVRRSSERRSDFIGLLLLSLVRFWSASEGRETLQRNWIGLEIRSLRFKHLLDLRSLHNEFFLLSPKSNTRERRLSSA